MSGSERMKGNVAEKTGSSNKDEGWDRNGGVSDMGVARPTTGDLGITRTSQRTHQ